MATVSSTDASAGAPAFSYAQAARGQVATPTTNSQSENSAPPSTTNTVGSSVTSSIASDAQDIPKALQESTDLSTLKNADSELSSVIGSVTQDSRDDAVSTAGSQSQAAQKASDPRRPRKGKKSKGQDKPNDDDEDNDEEEGEEKSKDNLKVVEQVKVQLSEAPIPSVNVWHERAKHNPAASKAVTTSNAAVPDAKKAENGSAGQQRTQRKPLDASRTNAGNSNEARRAASRAGRAPAAENPNPPSVQDPTSWPSIELAAADEPKSKGAEKPAQVEKQDENSASKAKKEWTHFPITPTYTYETQFSHHAKQPRPRGGARGGREAGSTRGGHASAAGPSADKESVAPSAAPKGPTEPKERARDATQLHGRQAPQAAAVPKRSSVDPPSREPRKPSGAPLADKAKSEHGSGPPPAKADAPVRGSRSDLVNGDHPPHVDRRKHSGERRDARSHDASVENNHHPTREGRSDRGRGGYRGRGGHNGSGHHQQGGFGPNGQRYMGGANGMASHPFNPAQNQYSYSGHGNGRKFPPRAQTGPSHSGQRPHNGGAVPSRMPSLPHAASAQEYPMQAYPPAYPTAHYGDELILQGLRAQIEFYFSLDNLAGDLYLRQRMDSQGYVPLATIASFRRVEALSPRYDFVQAACAHSQELDYVTGDDGTERIRSRHDMTPYILEFSRRAEEGKSNGPNSVVYHNLDRQLHPMPYANGFPHHMYSASPTTFHAEFPGAADQHAYPMYPPGGTHFGHGPVMNGHYPVNGHHQLSAAVPDFSPVSQPRPSIEEFQQFPDGDIDGLTVVLVDNKPRVSVKDALAAKASESKPNGSVGHDSSPSEDDKGANTTSYSQLRSQALEQRQKTAPGETSPDMHNLYKFWVDFLSASFNDKLYTEFRRLALDDGAKDPPSPAGIRYLLGFYEKLANSGRPYPAVLDEHYREAQKVSDTLSSVTNGKMHA